MNRSGLIVCAVGLAGSAGAASAQLTEGFEGAAFPPAGWATQNQSTIIGLSGWTQRSAATSGNLLPHSGTFFARDWYNAAGGAATMGTTISDWLIMPQMAISNGTQLAFWTISHASFPDRMQVRMSTAGPSTNTGVGPEDVGDFATLLLDINPTYLASANGGYPSVWTQFTVPVAGLPGAASGRFAFRYYVENGGPNGINSDIIGLDDVAVTAGTPPQGCYANCDQSTTVPFLNVLDFTCFLQKFAAAAPYANCDGSTTAPALNVLDFTCFLQKFAAGCSAP